jgi:hypothetical protein
VNSELLPPYEEPPYYLRGWNEPDGHGKVPYFRLRDFVALLVVGGIVGMLLVFPVIIFRWQLKYEVIQRQFLTPLTPIETEMGR